MAAWLFVLFAPADRRWRRRSGATAWPPWRRRERPGGPSARAGLGLGGIQVAALSATWYFYGYFTFLVTVLLTKVIGEALL
jgi:hypothetical protein